MRFVKGQINLNSILIVVIGALITFTLKKMDDNNTLLIKVSEHQHFMEARMEKMEIRLGTVEGLIFH